MDDNLHLRERQLELLLALDKMRDAPTVERDPESMFTAILNLLKEQFNTDACAILVQKAENASFETLVHDGLNFENAMFYCLEAQKNQQPAPIDTKQWANTLGMRVELQEGSNALGALFIARQETPFTEEEIQLLTLAESQIDSAIVQARLISRLARRNIELEAIYQIDRMRDDDPEERQMINAFTDLLVKYFHAELCMILLTHIDTGEMLLHGVADKHNLPANLLDSIREISDGLNIPQILETPAEIGDMMLLAAPFIVAQIKLGTVVIGRKEAFSLSDHSLLHAMMSQMDSAIVHSRVIQQLQQRSKELETIYRIDHIRDQKIEFDQMLQQVLSVICQAVHAEIGYLMLFSATEEKNLELKATTDQGLLTSPVYYQALNHYSRLALDAGEAVYSNIPDGPVRSIVAIPLILNERIIGVFGAVNSCHSLGFSAEDRRMLTAITSQVDTAVFERLERRQLRRVLHRSVDPKIIDHLLNRTDENILTGERVILTVLFADLRGSTEWAERTAPEELVSSLNAFLGAMTDVIFAYGGTLDKFVGDEVIALFGCPLPMGDHAIYAMRCALAMQETHRKLKEQLAEQGAELPEMGIGISTGEVIAGEIGTDRRSDFTAMGRTMNLGARLCSNAKPGQILISDLTYQITGNLKIATPIEDVALKGISSAKVYELLAIQD